MLYGVLRTSCHETILQLCPSKVILNHSRQSRLVKALRRLVNTQHMPSKAISCPHCHTFLDATVSLDHDLSSTSLPAWTFTSATAFDIDFYPRLSRGEEQARWPPAKGKSGDKRCGCAPLGFRTDLRRGEPVNGNHLPPKAPPRTKGCPGRDRVEECTTCAPYSVQII